MMTAMMGTVRSIRMSQAAEMLLYAEINVLCIVMMTIILVSAIRFTFDSSVKKRLFVGSVICGILANLFDLFWNFILKSEGETLFTAAWVVNIFYFSAFAVAGWFWFLYSEALEHGGTLKKSVVVISTFPMSVLVFFLILTRFNGCLFYIDDNGVYHRGALFALQYVLSYGYVILTSLRCFIAFIRNGRFRHDELLITMSIAAPPVVFGVVQLMFQALPIISVGSMISYLLVFVNTLQLIVSVDPLTGISNRRDFLRRLDALTGNLKKNKKLYLLFMDVDSFKKINDFFGHENGDRVLKAVAYSLSLLCENTDGICGRYGGDEFICAQILDKKEDIMPIVRTLHSFVEERCAKETIRCEVGVSIGVTAYRRGADTLESLIMRADQAMYENKQARRAARNAPNPGNTKEGLHSVTDWITRSEILNHLLLEHFDGALLIDAGSGLLMKINEQICGKFEPLITFGDVSYDTQMENVIGKLSRPQDTESLKKALRFSVIKEHLDKKGKYTVDFHVRCRENSDARSVYKKITYEYFDAKKALILLVSEDISSLVQSEKDLLTGSYNFNGFHNRVREWIAAHPDRKYRMQRYNIDRFRDINGIYGHDAGNKLLCDIARYMKRYDSEDSFSAHLNGDHFVRFCSDDSTSVQKCYDDFVEYFSNYELHVPLNLHIGVYDLCESDCDTVTMSYKALLAMQSIKGDMSRHICYYEKGMMNTEQNQRELLGDVERAIENDEFEVWFQPQVNYDDRSVIGAEALVRWRHPKHGLLMPASFIPLLEKSNYIGAVDACIVRKACRFMRRLMDEMPEKKIQVSVNLSRLNIVNRDFIRDLEEAVASCRVPIGNLHLEVTESAYATNDTYLRANVDELKKRGFYIEMDDFGAGYSTLNTLKNIHVDKLKLDMKFLSDEKTNKRGKIILSAVVKMTHALGMHVIAEGVESKEQADMLLSFGCRQMQGYYFGRPMVETEYERLLRGEFVLPALA